MAALSTKRYIVAFVAATLLSASATGIPTDLVPNSWFSRMTPIAAFDVVLWAALSVALGALLATYALPSCSRKAAGLSGGTGGGLLTWFAIGCPVCNKLVFLALGSSGALTYFAPLQPVIGVAALLLTVFVLRLRVKALGEDCPRAPIRLREFPELTAGSS